MTTPSDQAVGDLERLKCHACGSERSKVVITSTDRQVGVPGTFYASRCLDCGLLYQNPRVRPEDLGKFYPDDYAPYTVSEIALQDPVLWWLRHEQGYSHLPEVDLKPTARQKRFGAWSTAFHLIPDFKPGGRLIEIGCAAGNRLEMLHRLGWENITGYEYSDSAASVARDRGFNVVTGPIETNIAAVPDGSLDAVIAGFVIEHVLDPYALVRDISAKLKPGGQFLFCTIHVDSLDFRLYGTHWLDLDLPRHMVFFRKKDIRRMLAPSLEVESTHTVVNSNGFYGSARYREKDKVGGWRQAFDKALLKTYPILPAPMANLGKVGFGGRIFVSARKH